MNYYIDLSKLIKALLLLISKGNLPAEFLDEIIVSRDDFAPEKRFESETAPAVFACVMECYLLISRLHGYASSEHLKLILGQFQEKCKENDYEPTLEDIIIIISWITAIYMINLQSYHRINTPSVFMKQYIKPAIDILWAEFPQLK